MIWLTICIILTKNVSENLHILPRDVKICQLKTTALIMIDKSYYIWYDFVSYRRAAILAFKDQKVHFTMYDAQKHCRKYIDNCGKS